MLQQHPGAVADDESRRFDAFLEEAARHVETVEDLERAGVHAGGAGGVRALGLTVDERDVHALEQQGCGQGQSGGAGAHDEYVGVVHGWSSFSEFCQRVLVFPWCDADAAKVNTCWPTLVGMGRKADQTKAVILAAARERFAEIGLRGHDHPGDRGRREHRPVDGDAVLRQQGPVVRRGRRVRPAVPGSVRGGPRRAGPSAGLALPLPLGGRRGARRAAALQLRRMPKRRNG